MLIMAYSKPMTGNNNAKMREKTNMNAYIINILAEKRIRDLHDLTRTELIYSSTKRNECITTSIWPCVMRIASSTLNNSLSP